MSDGLLVAVEGIDGAGLSTQAARARDYAADHPALAAVERPAALLTKEPTDGPVGGEIRETLAGRLSVGAETLALMFAADRRDHCETMIEPALDAGKVVITDRYLLSSLAYQHVDVDDLGWLRGINERCVVPDLTVVVDVSAPTAVERLERDRFTTEIYERESDLAAIRESYDRIVDAVGDTLGPIRRVDGEQSKDAVERDIRAHLDAALDDLDG